MSSDSDEIKMYSKQWKVSEEEAKKTIEKIRNKKENEKVSKDKQQPELETGDPVTEFSKKIMGINQAAISTAETQRFLRAHPDDVEDLRGQIGAVQGRVGELYDGIGRWQAGIEGEIKNLTKILEGKDKEEIRAALIKEVTTSIDPLKKDLETVKERLMTGGEGASAEPKQYFEKARTVTEEAKGLLEQAGYKVTSGQVSREEVQKMVDEVGKRNLEEIPIEKVKGRLEAAGYKVEPGKLSREEVERMIAEGQKKVLETTTPEVFKKRLEAEGYKIVGGPLTYPQVEEMLKQERQKGQEEVLDDKRIGAVENIIRDSVKDIIELFKPAVDYYFSKTILGGPVAESKPASQQKETT